MNIVRGQLPDRLAAEYVLGTLTGGARRRFEALLPAHPALRLAVSDWEQRLLPMALKGAPLQPTPALWGRIERQLGWAPAFTAPVGIAARVLRLWQGLAAVTSVAALALAVLLRQGAGQPPAEAPMVIVLKAQNGSELMVAGLSPDRQRISIQPVQKVALSPERALELWAVPKAGKPTSLGLIKPDGITAVQRSALPRDTQALAVSLEPAGGSPTGEATGPVLFVGALTL